MSQEKLFRGISRWDLTAIAINTIIGAGIFGLPAKVTALIGSWSLVAFVVCALIVGLIVLCFAEVSSRFQSRSFGLATESESSSKNNTFHTKVIIMFKYISVAYREKLK